MLKRRTRSTRYKYRASGLILSEFSQFFYGSVYHAGSLAVVYARGKFALGYAILAKVAKRCRNGKIGVFPFTVRQLAGAVFHQLDTILAFFQPKLNFASHFAGMATGAPVVIDKQSVFLRHSGNLLCG
jgi:hypothetical protein